MNPEQDEFQQLRRLVVLKRYEQPPPGYFDDFSQQVIIRIRAGERIEQFSLFEALSWEAPWLQRFWRMLETRPIVAGGFGVAVCGVLLAGLLLSETRDAEAVLSADGIAAGAVPQAQTHLQVSTAPTDPLVQRVNVNMPFSGVSDPLAPIQPTDSLFQQLRETQRGRPDLIQAVPR